MIKGVNQNSVAKQATEFFYEWQCFASRKYNGLLIFIFMQI